MSWSWKGGDVAAVVAAVGAHPVSAVVLERSTLFAGLESTVQH